MAVGASISHTPTLPLSGTWAINSRTEAHQTEPASHWDYLVRFHAQAHPATTPGNSRVLETSCLGSRPMLKGASLGATTLSAQEGTVTCSPNSANRHPASPPGSAVVLDSLFSTTKAKSATLSIKQGKQANLKQTSLISFEIFPGVLSYPSP